MTLSEFIALVRDYTGFQDTTVQTNAKITSWVRMAEERTSSELRVADMVQIDTALITTQRVLVPSDWRAADFVRIVDGDTLEFQPRKEFYRLNNATGYFTTSGRYLMVGGPPDTVDGKTVELHYFGDVPQLTNDVDINDEPIESWLAERYHTILLNGTMTFAAPAMVDNSVDWDAKFTDRVAKVNDEYLRSIGSGSGLARRSRSFG